MQEVTPPAADSAGAASSELKQRRSTSWTELSEKNQSEFLNSAVYAAFQTPVTALAQVADTTLQTELLPKVQFMEAPAEKKLSDEGYWAQQMGTAVGSLVPYLVVGVAVKGVGRKALMEQELSAQKATLGLATREAVATGAIHDALLRPSDAGTASSLLVSRTINGAIGGANMLLMSKVSRGMASRAQDLLPQSALKHADVPIAALAGLPTGAATAQMQELAMHGKFATTEHMVQAALTNAVIGATFSGAHKFGLTAVEGQQKKFKAMDGEQAVKQALASIEGNNDATLAVRRDFGKVGLLGILGVKSFGPEQSLLIRNNTSIGASHPAGADFASIIASCNLDAVLSGKSVLGRTAKLVEQPVFMKAAGDRLAFSGAQPEGAGWQHLGLPPEAMQQRLSKVTVDMVAAREAIAILEKVKGGSQLNANESAVLEQALGIPKRTTDYDLSRTGQDQLHRLREAERKHAAAAVKKINELDAQRKSGVVNDQILAEEMATWKQISEAMQYRISGTEHRAPRPIDLQFSQNMGKRARNRIFELEIKERKQPLSDAESDLLSSLRGSQALHFNGSVQKAVKDLATIKETRALNFEEAARERIAAGIVDDGIAYYQGLEKVRQSEGLTPAESGSLQRLKETKAFIQAQERKVVDAITANNSPDNATTILSLRDRLKKALEATYQRQDATLFNSHMNATITLEGVIKSPQHLARNNLTKDAAIKLLEERREKLVAQETSPDGHKAIARDVRQLQHRVRQLDSRGDSLTPSQKAERAELSAIVGQNIEGMFREYILWAPENMATKSAHPAPKELRTASMQDGNNDEQAIAVALGAVLNKHQLKLGTPKPGGQHSAEYLDPRNWSGIHVPDNAAADHAKADYILFNKQTGHYFIFDITSSVDSTSRALLFHDMISRGTEVTLSDKKGTSAGDRRRFILATSPDVDWLSPAGFDKGVQHVSRLTAETILQDTPFNILDNQVLPSTNPLIPNTLKVAQLRSFQNMLRNQGNRDWADEINRSIGFLHRQR